MKKYIIYVIICIFALVAVGYCSYHRGYDIGYNNGYNTGYDEGYEERNALDVAKTNVVTDTKIVYKEIPYTGTDVQVRTEKPVVTVSVNGKQQKIEQKTATADLAVRTETAVKLRIPEKRWTFGIGGDRHGVTYMLKAPVKDAVGVWVAGGKGRVMGGVSVSF